MSKNTDKVFLRRKFQAMLPSHLVPKSLAVKLLMEKGVQ